MPVAAGGTWAASITRGFWWHGLDLPWAAAALSVLGPADFNTSCSLLPHYLKLPLPRVAAVGASPPPASARPAWDCIRLLLPKWHPSGTRSCFFFCLSSFIFAPSCSPVLCACSSRLPRSSWAPAAIKSRALRFALPMAPSPGSWDHSLPSPSSPARSHHHPLAVGAGFWGPPRSGCLG